jgi:hypothetical protein
MKEIIAISFLGTPKPKSFGESAWGLQQDIENLTFVMD